MRNNLDDAILLMTPNASDPAYRHAYEMTGLLAPLKAEVELYKHWQAHLSDRLAEFELAYAEYDETVDTVLE